MGYSFYYPPENKVLVARNAEFLENNLIDQEANGSLEDLKLFKKKILHPSITLLESEEEVSYTLMLGYLDDADDLTSLRLDMYLFLMEVLLIGRVSSKAFSLLHLQKLSILLPLMLLRKLYVRCRNRKTFETGDSSHRRKYGWRKKAEYNVNVEIFLKNQEFLAPKRTCHVNIVSLVGFCLEGRRRALIYEFMPNGSLEKFIYDRGSSSNSHLGWEKLHQIAIGIARGLEYLHRGCNTRILHLDIKPHNILLDQDFCPKISDFGLAKLFPEKRSMISMTDMRGTPGYIAPELFSRSFGGVSHKSDVYSYGMMILEMVGGRKNVQVEVDHTSEIYFPHWIYKKIELHEEQLGLHGIVSEVESEMARKMIIVGLWCIQTNSLSRPTMTKVVEMLEGGLELLEMPPKPYMFSPSRSADSSIIE
ncbi:protein kinase-like domain, concanavalin A-like lectin/glucanase domain protein [Tanacetum coccineum]